MARKAIIIGHAVDVWGDRWDVRERRETPHGFAVLLGWPSGTARGQGCGGPRVIITKRLAIYIDKHRAHPVAMTLPIGTGTIKRIRRLLGCNYQIDRAAWWERRIPDLASLTVEAFATRHTVSIGAVANAKMAYFGPTLRPSNWWQQLDIAAVLRAPRPVSVIADDLGIAASSVRRLRAEMTRERNK